MIEEAAGCGLILDRSAVAQEPALSATLDMCEDKEERKLVLLMNTYQKDLVPRLVDTTGGRLAGLDKKEIYNPLDDKGLLRLVSIAARADKWGDGNPGVDALVDPSNSSKWRWELLDLFCPPIGNTLG